MMKIVIQAMTNKQKAMYDDGPGLQRENKWIKIANPFLTNMHVYKMYKVIDARTMIEQYHSEFIIIDLC